MRNKYPGICYRCGKRVEAGKGHFEKIIGEKNGWRVQHAECAIKFRRKKQLHNNQERNQPMTINNMRAAVAAVYPKWEAIRTMTDDQVLAIYRGLQKRGKVK